jgi:hypothetical protein
MYTRQMQGVLLLQLKVRERFLANQVCRLFCPAFGCPRLLADALVSDYPKHCCHLLLT